MPTFQQINNYSYPDAVAQRNWDSKYFLDQFDSQPATSAVAGGAATGTAGDNNVLVSRLGNMYEWYVIGTQTILAPSFDGFGLNLVQDNTAGDGIEICQGVTAVSPASFIIGTDAAFMFRAEFKVQDVSGTNPLIIGFRKAQAFDATLANYTDFASIGIVGTAGKYEIQTQIGTAGVVATDTTQTATDGAVFRLAVYVDGNGVVTYTINEAAPTVTGAYTSTNGLTVVPFCRFTEAADVTTQASCDWWEVGYQPSFAPD